MIASATRKSDHPYGASGVATRIVSLVTETFPPEINGVARTISRLVDGLGRAGCDVEIVRPRQPSDQVPDTPAEGASGNMLVSGLRIPVYSELRMGLPAFARLRRRWEARRPEVVHIATEGPLGLSALAAARSLHIPTCSEFRTNFHAYSSHYGLGWLSGGILAYLRWFHNRSGCTMVATRALGAQLSAVGFQDLKIVARGVDTDRFNPVHRSAELRQAWGASPSTLVAAYVGRLAREKNLSDIVYAYRRLGRSNAVSKLVFVGDGPERAALKNLCPDAVFAGTREGSDLARHYASADIFLFSSLTETFGNVTVEAMASGLAVIAYDRAAAAECIRSGFNGMLVPPKDKDRFAACLLELWRNPETLAAMRRAARATAEPLKWERIVGAVMQIYERVIQNQTGHGVRRSVEATGYSEPVHPCLECE
jgi:glycosyltransferase involved in cell wall biosynthesis